MYKILIKYNSISSKTFWYSYGYVQDNGSIVEFSTDDIDELKKTVDYIDSKIGYKNIRVVQDVDCEILVSLNTTDTSGIEIATKTDIDNLYETAYNNVFG